MSANRVRCAYIAVLVAFLHRGTPVKITNLDVPKTAWNSVNLNCRYDLEGDDFYAVKWYKDNQEFFRCIKNGSVYHFPLEGINKIYTNGISHIGTCYFELMNLDEKSSGKYTCEISLDWPMFKIVSESAYLNVVDPPTSEQEDHQFKYDSSSENEATEKIDGQTSPVVINTGSKSGNFNLSGIIYRLILLCLIEFVFVGSFYNRF